MPDEKFAPLHLVADLRIDFSGKQGDAQAHLHGASDGLVLDVDNPAVLLSQARGQQLPLGALRNVIADTPIRVRSRGRELARVRLNDAGKVRLRPTPAGVSTVLAAELAGWRGRLLIGATVMTLTAGIVRRLRTPSR